MRLHWAPENVVIQPGLTDHRVWDDGDSCAVEVETYHTIQDGTEPDFPQVFIVEGTSGEITRWQAELPFGPLGTE